ncbi:MAG: hypothetical protein KKG76_14000 [Euryarchaeota archaeon]|nr:hypothetical protein [Euryarchaeota archaeon]
MILDNFTEKFPNVIAIGIIAFILISPVTGQTYNNTLPDSKNPKLESILSQLIVSDDMPDFAFAHNLDMQDGKVRVVIEMINETALLPDYVIEETRYKNKVQALVPMEKVEELSGETNVTFIRAPLKPYADIATPAATTPLKSGFNLVIPFILSMLLIFLFMKIRKW